MNINPLGINTYRQGLQETPARQKAIPEKNPVNESKDSLTVPTSSQKIGSSLAVKLKSETFMDMLSAEEKEAIDMLFEKYQAKGNGVYSVEGSTAPKSHLGNNVDIRL